VAQAPFHLPVLEIHVGISGVNWVILGGTFCWYQWFLFLTGNGRWSVLKQ
jgi:hypothetical protein